MKGLSSILNIIIIHCFLAISSSLGLQFHLPSFNNLTDIEFVNEDAWYRGQNASFDSSAIWLTPNPTDGRTYEYSNIGKIVYKDLVQFKNPQSDSPNKVFSFNTSFTFQIITVGLYGVCGSGMTFFISTFDKAPVSSDGRYFGLVDPNATMQPHFFAVEFDTHTSVNLKDPSASHIGIDVNSLISLNYTDTSPNSSSPFYPELYLYKNYTFTAWIEYNSATNLIQVWMTNSSTSHRPAQCCLQLSYNLSDVFQEFMYVGFSATNKAGEDDMEGHALFSWSFTSEDSDFKKHSHNSIVEIVVPSAVALVLCVLGTLALALFLVAKKKRARSMLSLGRVQSSTHTNRSGSSVLRLGSGNSSLLRYSYKELRKSAHGFSEQSKIGEGGFSSVYKGTLADGSMVAIKKLKETVGKEAEFIAEMEIISNLRHRNLLQLQGWCFERGEALLVYKYMSNGSLESYLYGKRNSELPSDTRLKILVGVASALEYLHDHLGTVVLHRDVKAANVLLNEGFEPLLGDFGLARLIGHDEGAVTMTLVGTPGYLAPEVVYTSKFTQKADVYSFGVLALEMAYGRPAMLRHSSSEEETRVVDYAWMLHQRNQLVDALDPRMTTDHMQKEQWKNVLHVALMCCNPSPEFRPTMRQVFQSFTGDTMLLKEPLPATRPLYSTIPHWPSMSRSTSVSLTGWSVSNSRSAEAGTSSCTTSK